MEKFKLDNNTVIEDYIQYCKDYIKDNPEAVIIIGCDSANQRKRTSYGIVICFRHPYKGVHVIHSIERHKKIRDIFTRLWKEVEYVAALGEILEKELEGYYHFRWNKTTLMEELGKTDEKEISDDVLKMYNDKLIHEKKVFVHVDLSKDPKYKSSRVYEAGLGYLVGLGYRVKTKPRAWAASVAADRVVQSG